MCARTGNPICPPDPREIRSCPPDPRMPTLLITGANRGIGLEAAAQFASSERFDKIILTVRSADKGPSAVAAAAAQSGKPASLFAFQILDLDSHASVRAAVGALPRRLDAVVLNAGNSCPGSALRTPARLGPLKIEYSPDN